MSDEKIDIAAKTKSVKEAYRSAGWSVDFEGSFRYEGEIGREPIYFVIAVNLDEKREGGFTGLMHSINRDRRERVECDMNNGSITLRTVAQLSMDGKATTPLIRISEEPKDDGYRGKQFSGTLDGRGYKGTFQQDHVSIAQAAQGAKYQGSFSLVKFASNQ